MARRKLWKPGYRRCKLEQKTVEFMFFIEWRSISTCRGVFYTPSTISLSDRDRFIREALYHVYWSCGRLCKKPVIFITINSFFHFSSTIFSAGPCTWKFIHISMYAYISLWKVIGTVFIWHKNNIHMYKLC